MPHQSSDASALDMPDIRIRSRRLRFEQEIIIEIESTHTMLACRQCGCMISDFIDYDAPRRLPADPTAGGLTRISFYPKRFRCPHCADHPMTIEQFIWPSLAREVHG